MVAKDTWQNQHTYIQILHNKISALYTVIRYSRQFQVKTADLWSLKWRGIASAIGRMCSEICQGFPSVQIKLINSDQMLSWVLGWKPNARHHFQRGTESPLLLILFVLTNKISQMTVLYHNLVILAWSKYNVSNTRLLLSPNLGCLSPDYFEGKSILQGACRIPFNIADSFLQQVIETDGSLVRITQPTINSR